MVRIALFTGALVILFSCREEEIFTPTYEIPADAQEHVSAFFELSANEGLMLDTTNLIVSFTDELNSPDGTPICGNASGTLTGDLQNTILIDRECLAWRHSKESREILIFHELGHVFLERTHVDDLLPNEDYKSIMFGGNWNILRFYTEDLTKRSYYLEELFDPEVPIPDWSK
ncbi:MAG: hypothetical protein WBA74_15100 [Cyclobacteriaceae bacterium]